VPKNILFVASVYRVGEKVYPILERLASLYTVDVLLLCQMSPKAPWAGDMDLRQSFYTLCQEICRNVIIGASQSELNVKINRTPDYVCQNLNIKDYNLVILDDNLCRRQRGTACIYKAARKIKIPVIACSHGNREFDGYISNFIGKAYDYSFVLGKKEVDRFSTTQTRKYLYPAGIPSNDCLKNYKRRNKHILVITNGVTKKLSVKLVLDRFCEQTFLDIGILDLADKFGCPIIIKEKSRYHRKGKLELPLEQKLQKYSNVKCVMDIANDNQLIADSVCVISTPSTISFKHTCLPPLKRPSEVTTILQSAS